MNWNFIDPEMPTNKQIIDKSTWARNFKVVQKHAKVFSPSEKPENTDLKFNRLLTSFTYKDAFSPLWDGDKSDYESNPEGLIEPEDKKFNKYAELNGIFGADKINRPDVNAVPLGH